MMKQYNYAYDAIHDRLNKMMSRNWGKLLRIDIAKVPKNWTMDKWLYYAKSAGLAVDDSFREGNIGASTGKLAGALNNNSTGVIDAEFGNSIQSQINLLEYIKNEMSEVAGISKQREGQISNRETVGGVERATLQSSHITEWLFGIHDDVKRRSLECFLETAKIAMKGRNKKFQYITSDMSTKIMDIDGDEFAECDYGLVVDNSSNIQGLNQKLDMLAQAALQNQALNFSTIMKLYTSTSAAEKQRMIESNEQQMQQQRQQEQQAAQKMQQEQLQAAMAQKELDVKAREEQNIRDNETRILVAKIHAESNEGNNNFALLEDEFFSEHEKAELDEKKRQFDEKMKLEKAKLEQSKKEHAENLSVKRTQANKSKPTANKQ